MRIKAAAVLACAITAAFTVQAEDGVLPPAMVKNCRVLTGDTTRAVAKPGVIGAHRG